MLTSHEISKINKIAYQAGTEILKIYDTTFEVEIKDDNSPLTIADKKSHQIIEKGLTNLFPNIPILSEEGISIDYSQRSKWKKYWLIDPLDGTKEFVKKNGEFTVNIALIENDKSIFGSVYAPYTKELFWAHKGMGSWKSLNKRYKSLTTLGAACYRTWGRRQACCSGGKWWRRSRINRGWRGPNKLHLSTSFCSGFRWFLSDAHGNVVNKLEIN